MLGLRWVIVALNQIFTGHALRWGIVALNLILFWTCWDWGERLVPSNWTFSGHAGTEFSCFCPQSDLLMDMLGLSEWLLPSIGSFSGHAWTEVSECGPKSELFLDILGLRWLIVALNRIYLLVMLGLRWAIVALNLIFFWTYWESGEWLLPSIWCFSRHAGTEVSDCCPQSDLFLDMRGQRLAIVALNLIFFWTCWDWGEG